MRGDEELARRAADLAGRLPGPLAPLARIAYNYRWRWYPGGKEVFRSIDRERWALCGENPVRMLQETAGEALARAAGDSVFLARVAALEGALVADLERPAVAPGRPVAFSVRSMGCIGRCRSTRAGLGGWLATS